MSTLAKCLKASLLCSMSQSILFPIGAENKLSAKDVPKKQLTVASQSCRDALQILDELNSTQTEHHSDHPHVQQFDALVGQALSLVASCYTIAGSAVTAQGLFQSALDKYSESSDNFLFKNIDYNPYSLMWYRDTLGRYASLCQQWEKREREAETLFGKQKELEEEHMSKAGGINPIFSVVCGSFPWAILFLKTTLVSKTATMIPTLVIGEFNSNRIINN